MRRKTPQSAIQEDPVAGNIRAMVELAQKAREDRTALERMTDAEISDGIKRDPDARETTPEFLRRGRVVHPSDRKQSVTIRLDTDVVRFFSTEGPGYQTRINSVLRDYVRRRRTG